jgi:hypothetical protein
VKLFQIEEPDGSPVDPAAPGVAIGVDLGGREAEVAVAVGGNAAVLMDRDGFALDLVVPAADAPAEIWRDLFEGARLRAERALAQPVTHAVIALGAPAEPAFADKLTSAALAAGLTVLDLVSPDALGAAETRAAAAAVLAEDQAPRPEPPLPGPG